MFDLLRELFLVRGDFREEDFTLKQKGKPVKGLEEYRRSRRLLERAKKDTARCFLSQFEAFWDGMYKKSIGTSDLQRLERALRAPRVMEDALELKSLFAKDLPKKSAAELVRELRGLRAAQFRELHRLAAGETGPFRADDISGSLESARIDFDRVNQSLKDIDTQELTKRLSYTLAVTGLVLLGGYAVMLAQK
eukprot:Skav230110  [mRNA]  locus=scaffold283:199430:201931:- [translate_table: standard]